jgi:hypothetical protein
MVLAREARAVVQSHSEAPACPMHNHHKRWRAWASLRQVEIRKAEQGAGIISNSAPQSFVPLSVFIKRLPQMSPGNIISDLTTSNEPPTQPTTSQ